jgi:hypothetical protein
MALSNNMESLSEILSHSSPPWMELLYRPDPLLGVTCVNMGSLPLRITQGIGIEKGKSVLTTLRGQAILILHDEDPS